MTIVLNDVLRVGVEWKYRVHDDQVNVFLIKVKSIIATPSDEEVEITIGQWLAEMYSEPMITTADDIVHHRTTIFNMTQNVPMIDGGAYSTLNGQSNGDPLPTGVAALCFARTGHSRVVGKKYLPTWAEAASTDGVWDTGNLARMQAFCDVWKAEWEEDLLWTFQAVIGKPGVGQHYFITQALPSQIPAYQRRRRVGRGS